MKNNQKRRFYLILILFQAFFLSACGIVESAQQTQMPENNQENDEANYWIRIQNVQVREKEAIEFSGSTNVPEGNCLFTELYGDDVLVSWWPTGKCFPSTAGDYQFSISLGEEGAPELLDTAVQYSLQVYWPGAPNEVRAAFPFDLTPPPSQD